MSEIAFSLILSIPGDEPTRHILFEDTVTFGRSSENEIQILVPEVSVKHGRLEREGGSYRLFDNGSTNGTRVNGRSVGPEGVLLKPMDRFVVGTLVPAYFVPTAVLESTPLEDLVASLEKETAPAAPATAPIAIASPSRPSGTATLPVRGPSVSPTPLRQPGAPAPQAPNGAPEPLKPAASAVPGPQPARPAAPVPAAPKPAAARPVSPLGPGTPFGPGAPFGPSGPQPIPLKRPAPASPAAPAAPAAPSVPLPKNPGA